MSDLLDSAQTLRFDKTVNAWFVGGTGTQETRIVNADLLNDKMQRSFLVKCMKKEPLPVASHQ